MDNEQLHKAVETFRAAYAAMKRAEISVSEAYAASNAARAELDQASYRFGLAKSELLRLAANVEAEAESPYIPSLT